MIIRKRYLQAAILLLATIRLFTHGVPASFHSIPNSPAGKDFIPIYAGARCLLYGCNPYQISEIQNQFLKSGATLSDLPLWQEEPPVYPPAIFLVVSPMAPLSYQSAHLLWVLINAVLITIAASLVWFYAPPDYSWVATLLSAATIMTSRGQLLLGQPANAAIALFTIAVVLFLKGRYINCAVAALLLSLSIKPQIAGLVALYLFWQRIHWKHVVAAMIGAVAVLLVAIGILQMRPASQSWLQDWRGNIAGSILPGATNDPRPEYKGSVDDVNLDAITSVFFSDTQVFHAVSLAAFAVLLGTWLYLVRQSAAAGKLNHALNLTALSILTLLPIYHRTYDIEITLISVLAIGYVFRESLLLGMVSLVPTFIFSTITYRSFVERVILPRMPREYLLHKPLLFLIFQREKNLMLFLELAIFLYIIARLPATSSLNAVNKQAHVTAV